MNTPNIGWLFNKAYFEDLYQSPIELDKIDFAGKNRQLFEQKLADRGQVFFENMEKCEGYYSFPLQTTYPGLLSGTGLQHEVKHPDALKLGFSFDHTTGLPYIPGSSVKGLLRSYFPGSYRRLAEKLKADEPAGEWEPFEQKAASLEAFFREYLLLEMNIPAEQAANLSLTKLEANLFEGIDPTVDSEKEEDRRMSVYDRDIFLDAYPQQSFFRGRGGNDESRFLGEGVITPHKKNPLKNPIPIKFLKVLPAVSFSFQFIFKPTAIGNIEISAMHKFELFRQLLQHFGIGAKTNVGFGQLEEN